MSKETTYAGVLGDLQRLRKALAANGADLTHLEGQRAKFDEALDQAQEIVNHQSAQIRRRLRTTPVLRLHILTAETGSLS